MVQGDREGESPKDGTGQEVSSFGEADDAHQVDSGSGAHCPGVLSKKNRGKKANLMPWNLCLKAFNSV